MPDLRTLAYAAAILVQGVLFFRWLHKKMRDDEINRAFIRDVATNHLPHIYYALAQMASAAGVEIGNPPAVRWIDVENGRK